MTTLEITKEIVPVLKKFDVSFVGLFGSRSRGEAKENSDLDLLVRFRTPKSLFELIGLENELSRVLHLNIDIVTEGALHPLLKSNVLKDLRVLYGQR